MEHWILYIYDRDNNELKILGIFNSKKEAWNYYSIYTNDNNYYYWDIPLVEQWENEIKKLKNI